jgi:hypothetical protein
MASFAKSIIFGSISHFIDLLIIFITNIVIIMFSKNQDLFVLFLSLLMGWFIVGYLQLSPLFGLLHLNYFQLLQFFKVQYPIN